MLTYAGSAMVRSLLPEVEVTARELDYLARELVARPQNLTDGQPPSVIGDGSIAGTLLFRAGHIANSPSPDATSFA